VAVEDVDLLGAFAQAAVQLLQETMIVLCKTDTMPKARLPTWLPRENPVRKTLETYPFAVTPGERYTVFGLRFADGLVWAFVEWNVAALIAVPVDLFEIVDPRPSKLWYAHVSEDGVLTLGPGALNAPYFIDDLQEGRSDAVDAFSEMKREIEKEQTSMP
jgi:hypothetical protein